MPVVVMVEFENEIENKHVRISISHGLGGTTTNHDMGIQVGVHRGIL